jgi:hypothetical protein
MAIKLSRRSYEHAQKLVREGKVVLDDRDDWSEHQPSSAEENRFIEEHGWKEYGRWHLGVDESRAEDTKARYSFPYGDFADVHRCALLSAESRAGQYDHEDVKSAAAHLHGMLEGARAAT